jgi:hypothetical protein
MLLAPLTDTEKRRQYDDEQAMTSKTRAAVDTLSRKVK